MLDKGLIGHRSEPRSIAVEAGQLKFFAKATGETNPVYFDEAAAKAAGHPDLPAPPTFLFSLALLAPAKADTLDLFGVDIGRVLHGEQRFSDLKPIHAGDVITLTSEITDLYDKRGGALDFIVLDTEAKNQRGEPVGTSRTITVVRNG